MRQTARVDAARSELPRFSFIAASPFLHVLALARITQMEDPHAESVIWPSPPVAHQASAGIDPLTQVAAKMAGAVHSADVLILVKSMISIQGQRLTSFREARGITLTEKNAALVSNISRKVGRRAGRV